MEGRDALDVFIYRGDTTHCVLTTPRCPTRGLRRMAPTGRPRTFAVSKMAPRTATDKARRKISKGSLAPESQPGQRRLSNRSFLSLMSSISQTRHDRLTSQENHLARRTTTNGRAWAPSGRSACSPGSRHFLKFCHLFL